MMLPSHLIVQHVLYCVCSSIAIIIDSPVLEHMVGNASTWCHGQ
jgi:hypothetical protein